MKKYSAMIVDDSETDRYLLKRFLKKTDLIENIFEVNNGKDALNFLKEQKENEEEKVEGFPPTLLFLDINMPLMGGFEFLEKYQDFEDLSITIMMFSSSANDEDRKRAFSFSFVKDFLIKGAFKVEDLKQKIEKNVK